MKILAIPATNSTTSINRALLAHAAQIVAEIDPTATVEFVDINDYEMAIFSPERQAEGGVPDKARELFDRIGAADAVMVSFAEHNGSYSAAWKNILDWMSRIDMGFYQGKRVVMFAATPGARGGAGVLGTATATAPFFGAELVGHLGVGSFGEAFDLDAGALTDPDLAGELGQVIAALVA